jgi:hypothetical protein
MPALWDVSVIIGGQLYKDAKRQWSDEFVCGYAETKGQHVPEIIDLAAPLPSDEGRAHPPDQIKAHGRSR